MGPWQSIFGNMFGRSLAVQGHWPAQVRIWIVCAVSSFGQGKGLVLNSEYSLSLNSRALGLFCFLEKLFCFESEKLSQVKSQVHEKHALQAVSLLARALRDEPIGPLNGNIVRWSKESTEFAYGVVHTMFDFRPAKRDSKEYWFSLNSTSNQDGSLQFNSEVSLLFLNILNLFHLINGYNLSTYQGSCKRSGSNAVIVFSDITKIIFVLTHKISRHILMIDFSGHSLDSGDKPGFLSPS